MADEPVDQRPRRRLFGRRRAAQVDESPDRAEAGDQHNRPTEEPVAALAEVGTPDPISLPDAPVSESPEADRAEEPEVVEPEAIEPEVVEPEEPVAEVAAEIGVPAPEGFTEPPALPEPAIDEPAAAHAEAPESEEHAGPPEPSAPALTGTESSEQPAPVREDEEAMVTANAPMPDVTAPTDEELAAELAAEIAEEIEEGAAEAATETATSTRSASLAEELSVAPNEAAGELPLPRVIAIANQKGGVGKTTTAVNLGAALAEAGFRVLVVDLDPQGNASTGLGINHRDVESSVYDVIMNDAPALDCVEPTSLKNLFVLPATIDLAGAEIELVSAFSRELKLRRALDAVRPEYDIILIDCPPSLGLLTVNGLAAADDVIVPVQSEYYALEGLGQLLKNVSMVRSLNPTLDVRGIVLTMHDSRTKLAEQVESEVRQHFGARVYKTVVPRTVRLSEAPSFGQPIIVFDPTSRGATAYRELAKEVSGGATRRSR